MIDTPTSPLSRRRFLSLTGGVGAAAALAACGGTSSPGGSAASAPQASDTGSGGQEYSGPAVTLAFWNGLTGGDGDVIKKMVNEFNAQAKNVKVTMNIYQWADLFQKLPAAVKTGRGPDVGILHIDDIPTNAARGIIVPIDKVVTALGLQESDFSPAVWQGGVYKGLRYGIPLDIHPLCMYWNKGVLQKAGLDPEKPPTTKDEFMSALDQLKGKGIQGHWVTPFQFTGGFEFQSLLWQYGGDTFDSGLTKATFDSDAGVQALTWMVDLVKNGYSPKNVGQDADYVAFKNNKNAFNFNGIWQINDLKTTSLQWGCGPVPQIGSKKAVWGNSHQFVQLHQNSPDQHKVDATRYFINWMSQRSAEWATSGKIPARKSVAESADFKNLSPENALAEEATYVHFPQAAPGIGDALAEMYTAVNKAVLMKSSPQQALSDGAKKATQVLQDNKKKYGA
ncbi:carbohydrate ABC transporter substrate-binding protein (CUT1 family) [Motilibacter rhizosphaerae]|uniref:Carbohydrate ABC transporter substrate-binding protein (CUT1 family) n=1 Tax=Motilibacter rhizosphaerae TaxID=598652 RepID=A0A4Q7NFQ4_9ACTN|nr:ABC transporter substrate-binding protein [Motilibacter rhizosphaerae]RZS82721.1 carbohydrate ABC transporter substrate-binding protein (CUT1 family) [Motilibacter rhizosphaerae]